MPRLKKLAARRQTEHQASPRDDCVFTVEDIAVENEVAEGDDERENFAGDGGGIDREETAGGDNFVTVEVNGGLVLTDHFGEIAGEDIASDDSSDDMWNDDENVHEPLSSEDDEEEFERHGREDSESADEILALGKTYGSASDFKLALLRYTLKTCYNIKLYISTQKKLGAVCCDPKGECEWRVYFSYERRKRKLQIKVFQSKHSCIRYGYSKMLKPSTIAHLFEDRLRVNPKLLPVEMVAELYQIYGLIVSEEQCRKAKTKLSRARRASHEAHFSRIWDYEAELRQSNEGTITDIQTIPGPKPGSKQRFDRFYVCFGAQRVSWKSYCRPIIGLDGAFLKWDIKGQLLAAIGRDGDNRVVPIAWAVVEIENDANWDWFVDHLQVDLGLGDGRNFTIISDKQKGLVKAVHNVLPEAEHRMCARHILGNWKRDSHDPELETLFWKIARSYTKGDFTDNMTALERYSKGAYESLQKTKPESWSRAFFKVGSCCNDILNNLNESFNRTIKEARRKPLLDLLEDIRRKCMVRTARRYVMANRLRTRFTKSAHIAIELANKNAKKCTRYVATGDIHEILADGCGYHVEMVPKTCGCGKWQLNGIPCEHVASVIIGKKENVDDYVSHYFTTDTWKLTYQQGIQPVQGMKLWPRLNRMPVLPPPNRLGKRGRPSNYERKKAANEPSSTQTKLSRQKRIMTCSNCREEGHNKLTCSNQSVEPEAKRPRGRPRKELEGGSQEGVIGSNI